MVQHPLGKYPPGTHRCDAIQYVIADHVEYRGLLLGKTGRQYCKTAIENAPIDVKSDIAGRLKIFDKRPAVAQSSAAKVNDKIGCGNTEVNESAGSASARSSDPYTVAGPRVACAFFRQGRGGPH